MDVSAVQDVEGAGLGDQLVEHPHVVPSAVADMDESWDIAAQIQEGVELDGGLGALERGPGEDREAEVDGGRVEGIDGVVELEAEAVLGIERPGDADQRLGEVGMDAPVAPLVGVGQGGAGDAPADAHVVELGVLGAQAGLDVAQALAIGQLREGHAQIPIEAGEASQPAIAAVAVDATAQAVHGQMVDHLGENDLACIA